MSDCQHLKCLRNDVDKENGKRNKEKLNVILDELLMKLALKACSEKGASRVNVWYIFQCAARTCL